MAIFHHQPRKRFGQHFLTDPGVISQIIAVLSPQPGDFFVEIGPGMGALTLPLLQKAKAMTAIELDRDIIPKLAAKAKPMGSLHLIEGDVLTISFDTLYAQEPLRIVGNLPYNISSPILFHCLKFCPIIQDLHFMSQKEVVDRMCASPGNKDYGRLSVMLQYFCRIEACFDVPPEAFDPPPKVNSSVVCLTPLPAARSISFPFENFEEIVRLAFGQRRKTLRNALKTVMTADQIERAGIDPQARAETLSVEAFIQLTAELK